MKSRLRWLVRLSLVVALAVAAGCSTVFVCALPASEASPPLHDFAQRLPVIRQQLPPIITSAESAALRQIDHPGALINVPYNEQPAFAEEILNRSGGLGGALPSEERPSLVTNDDIVLFSIRSWEQDGEAAVKTLESYREQGWMVVLFASAADKPKNLRVDFLIDNGAPTGGAEHASINTIANCLNGWVWVCEYAAAATRHGYHPGFLQSITMRGSNANNRIYRDRKISHLLFLNDEAVERHRLADIYLRRIDRMVSDLADAETIQQINAAADIIAARLRAGKRVIVTTNSHLLLNDLDDDHRTPWLPINTHRNAEKVFADNHVDPGDLLVWFGYNGMSVWYDKGGEMVMYADFDKFIRATGADFIVCAAHDHLHPDNNGQGALAYIEQPWSFGDAEVPVPFAPGKIAPVSGLIQGLLYRMLDHAVVERMAIAPAHAN